MPCTNGSPEGSRSPRRVRPSLAGGDVSETNDNSHCAASLGALLIKNDSTAVQGYEEFRSSALSPDSRGNNIMDLFAPSHLLLLLLVILVIFGPSKLGDVGGALGKCIRDFKRAITEPDNESGEN